MNDNNHLKHLIKETVKRVLRENSKAELFDALVTAFEENPRAAKKVLRMPDEDIEDAIHTSSIDESLMDTFRKHRDNLKDFRKNPSNPSMPGTVGGLSTMLGMGAGFMADRFNWGDFINNLTGEDIANPERIAAAAAALVAAGVTAAFFKDAASQAARKK